MARTLDKILSKTDTCIVNDKDFLIYIDRTSGKNHA